MIIIGLDPGTATTGFGLIEVNGGKSKYLDAGVITTPADSPMPERLETIYTEVRELMKEYKPDLAAIELLYFGNNVTTAISVGQARGVLLLASYQRNLEIVEYTPLQIKMAITGFGRADKPQVQSMVQTLLGLKTLPRPDDAADALAVALCAAHSIKK